MKALKFLYKKMYDDVKDSEMLLGYAKELKDEEGMGEVAKYFATEALNRSTKAYKDAHAMFHALMAKCDINLEKEPVGCIVEEMLEELDAWHRSIVKCLEKL